MKIGGRYDLDVTRCARRLWSLPTLAGMAANMVAAVKCLAHALDLARPCWGITRVAQSNGDLLEPRVLKTFRTRHAMILRPSEAIGGRKRMDARWRTKRAEGWIAWLRMVVV
jgi:hypothetical protein